MSGARVYLIVNDARASGDDRPALFFAGLKHLHPGVWLGSPDRAMAVEFPRRNDAAAVLMSDEDKRRRVSIGWRIVPAGATK